jgi:hypothetical protein
LYGDKDKSLTELKRVVNDVLGKRQLNNIPLGCYFDRVVFSKYIPPA